MQTDINLVFPRLSDPKIVVFDLETTMHEPRLIREFGCVVVEPTLMTIIEERNYVGIIDTNNKSIFEQYAHEIYKIMDGRVWMGHNIVAFDIPILEQEFLRIGQSPPIPSRVIDTLSVLSHWKKSGIAELPQSLSLQSLMFATGLNTQQHKALDDARMTLTVAIMLFSAPVFASISTPHETKRISMNTHYNKIDVDSEWITQRSKNKDRFSRLNAAMGTYYPPAPPGSTSILSEIREIVSEAIYSNASENEKRNLIWALYDFSKDNSMEVLIAPERSEKSVVFGQNLFYTNGGTAFSLKKMRWAILAKLK